MKKNKILFNNLEPGMEVKDSKGNIGIVVECDNIHNVLVEYEEHTFAYHCLDKKCKEKTSVNDEEIEVSQYNPLYYCNLTE